MLKVTCPPDAFPEWITNQ